MPPVKDLGASKMPPYLTVLPEVFSTINSSPMPSPSFKKKKGKKKEEKEKKKAKHVQRIFSNVLEYWCSREMSQGNHKRKIQLVGEEGIEKRKEGN